MAVPIIWFVLVLIGSVIPVSGPKTDVPADKVVHFIMYGISSVLLFRIFIKRATVKRAFYLSVAIAAFYGAAMEIIQYFLPYRSFSFADMAANTLGALLACVLYVAGRRR